MTKFRLSGARALSLLLIGASLLGLAGCNPVGNGAGPVRLTVNGPNGALDADTGNAYVCLRGGLTASLFFTNGDAADFTQRVTWTSSDDNVVRVSNDRTEPNPAVDGSFFQRGVLTPVGEGTARITAAFGGFTDSIDITVSSPTDFRLKSKNPQTNIPADLVGNAVRIAPRSIIDLDIQAVLDGRIVAVDGAANWSFVTPDTAVATIDGNSGVVVGVAAPAVAGTPLIARVAFRTCDLTFDAAVTVAPLTALSISRQFGSDPLITGNTESFTVLGDFGDGPEQDLSIQAVFTSSALTTAAFNSLPGVTNVLSALQAGTTDVSATFNTGTIETPMVFTTPTLTVTTQADTLTAIALAPAELAIIAGASTVTPLVLTGTYASGLTQIINRRALFESDNTRVAQVSNATQTVGQVVSGGPLDNVLTDTPVANITATVANLVTPSLPFVATTVVTASDPAPSAPAP